MTIETVGLVCDGIRIELENRDLNRYINSVLTAYVIRQPPDYEAGLGLLLRIRGAPLFPSLEMWADETGADLRQRAPVGRRCCEIHHLPRGRRRTVRHRVGDVRLFPRVDDRSTCAKGMDPVLIANQLRSDGW